MSSCNRIPKSSIKISDTKVAINDKFSTDEEFFKKSTVEEYIKKSREKIEEEERKMLQEMEEKRQSLIEKAHEEGRQWAFQEAEKKIREEFQELIEKANEIYQNANKYYERMIEEAEEKKMSFLQEKKEEIMDVILLSVQKTINQGIDTEQIKVEEIYDHAISKIKYDTKKIFVRVHPTTQELLLHYKKAQLDKRIEFLCDLNLEQADFILETEREFVDLSIQTQLEEMKEYLRGVMDA